MNWRTIYANAPHSRSLRRLSDFGERLFWRMLSATDSWGRLDGDPEKLMVICVPEMGKTIDDVASALQELVAVDRVLLYQVDGDVVAQLVDFDKWQAKELIRKRGASRFPAPDEATALRPAPEKAGLGRTSRAKSRGEKRREVPSLSSEGTRPRDVIWDTLVTEIGYQPSTKSARGAWNVAVKELRDAGATAETVKACCAAYRKAWPTVELSPNALAKWWDRFLDAGGPARLASAAMSWAETVGWQYPAGSVLDAELDGWRKRGADEHTILAMRQRITARTALGEAA